MLKYVSASKQVTHQRKDFAETLLILDEIFSSDIRMLQKLP